tara:strand:+ start:376 stop:846 length:471 start_codon:yes stop_codon:yes gene_type:complete
MATASKELVEALRATALRVSEGAAYQWGHYGHCNCGHLAQTLTGHGPHELQRRATASEGEWRDQAQEHCPTSGAPLGEVIGEMLGAGLSIDDIVALETLDHPRVLERLPDGRRHLRRNQRQDLVLYLHLWADLLSEELPREAEGGRTPAVALSMHS